MRNSDISFESLYKIIRDYFTEALPHYVSDDSSTIIQPFLKSVGSHTKVKGRDLDLISLSKKQLHVIDEVLKDSVKRYALAEDIKAFLLWLAGNGYLEWDGSGNGAYRATDKMLQVKKLTNS